MNILFCAQTSPSKTLGGSKVVVELAESMRTLGWHCTVVGPEDIAAEITHIKEPSKFRERLRCYLHKHAAEYDVVDYDHNHLPYDRAEFAPSTLFVARSVLLAHHFDKIQIPQSRRWKSRIGRLLRRRNLHVHRHSEWAQKTVQEADIVNVSNQQDKAELIRHAILQEKIVVLPFGLDAQRRQLFDAVSAKVPPEPIVAFVGTFDYRKGAQEFPRIVQHIADKVPNVRFRLLGTAGLFQTAKEVYAVFPKHLRKRIEVVPKFPPDKLPEMLSPCSVGIFPSYIEGFGFGVLEMLAAAVPVIAYDAPGPPEMLTAEYLVTRADAESISRKVVFLLNNPMQLYKARMWAQQRSRLFDWEQIAKQTGQIYQSRWQEKNYLLNRRELEQALPLQLETSAGNLSQHDCY